MPKRRKIDDGDTDVDNNPTPLKTRRTSQAEDHDATPKVTAETPSKRKSILKGTPTKARIDESDAEPTPKSLRKVLFATPSRVAEDNLDENPSLDEGEDTPTAFSNVHSDCKKSASTSGQTSGLEGESYGNDEQETALAEQILEEHSGSGDDDVIQVTAPSPANDTPRKRGRPKGRKRERTPSPPPDLPPHELFFFKNRGGGNKTSGNTLLPNHLLNHDDYFAQVKAYKDPHESDIERLFSLHKRGFDQWVFELQQGFNLCLYGYGSKRQLAMDFTEHLHAQTTPSSKTIVINGYIPGLTVRDVLTIVATTILSKTTKLPAQPPALLELILSTLTASRSPTQLHITIHSLDHPNLRKYGAPALLACLAAHPSITLLATCDNPNFSLLWDTTLLRQFHWLYHDATTFQPYATELDVVEDVNALLGRSGRRLGGKDGVAYVLKSLPENARRLFALLVAEQLALADSMGDIAAGGLRGDEDFEGDDNLGVEDDDDAFAEQQTPSKRGRGRPEKARSHKKFPRVAATVAAAAEGVEYRTLYHKAVAEFVCSSEVNFRTLLKEFHDHQMVESRRDGLGTERLVAPFGREELEGWLEELI